MDIVDRFLKLADERFKDDVEFAKAIGTKPQRVSEWRLRKSTSYKNFVAEIATVLSVTTDYLYFGKLPEYGNLAEEEVQLVQAYRKADAQAKKIVNTTLEPFGPSVAHKKAT